MIGYMSSPDSTPQWHAAALLGIKLSPLVYHLDYKSQLQKDFILELKCGWEVDVKINFILVVYSDMNWIQQAENMKLSILTVMNIKSTVLECDIMWSGVLQF
jgi:hypothetical protein